MCGASWSSIPAHGMRAYCFDVHRKLVEFRLAPDDLSAIRFGISSGHELVHAVRVMSNPQLHPLQWGWLRSTRALVAPEDLTLLRLVVGDDGYAPDFFTVRSEWDLTPQDEIARFAEHDPTLVAADLGKRVLRTTGPQRRILETLALNPLRTRDVIAKAWSAFWDAAMAPYWPQIERLLRADIGVRARRMSQTGTGNMVATLHEAVSWSSGAVQVWLHRHEETLDCAGSGLVLVPSVMANRCAVLTEHAAQPTLFYPAQGVSETWTSQTAERSQALAALLGEGRARILLAVEQPLSTTELAHACGLAVSTVSHHLTILRGSGLIDSRRAGASVLHTRTTLGEALIQPGRSA